MARTTGGSFATGTGRYSVTLAAGGYDVTAVELIPHNLAQLEAKRGGGAKPPGRNPVRA